MVVLQFLLPLVLLRLLTGLSEGAGALELYGLAVLLFAITAVRVAVENHYFYQTFRLGAQASGSCSH